MMKNKGKELSQG